MNLQEQPPRTPEKPQLFLSSHYCIESFEGAILTVRDRVAILNRVCRSPIVTHVKHDSMLFPSQSLNRDDEPESLAWGMCNEFREFV